MEIYENKIHLTIRQGDLHVNTEHINDDNQQTLSLSFGRWFKGDVGPIGPPGLDGNDGKDAQINGRNTITIAAGENISITDIENGIQIAANGGALFLAEVNEEGTQLITPFDDILEAYNNGNVVYLKMPFFGVFLLAPLVAIHNDLNRIVFDAHFATPDIHLDGGISCTSDGQVEFQMYLPNWDDIQNKPTKLSEFENDTQFITEQSLEGYATESWVTDQHYLTEHQDISGKVDRSDLATVATTGNYNDLSNKPTIPSLDGLITQQEFQASIASKVDKIEGKQLSTNDFTNADKTKLDSTPTTFAPTNAQANIIEIVKVNNQTLTPSNKTVNISIPTKTSDLTNDSNFLTSHQSLSGYATENWVENKGYLTQHQDISNKADKSEIPTKISQLNNDSNFIKNTVNNLTNYYTKTNIYTKSEVEGLIAAINQFHYEIVTVLPTTGEGNVLYLKGPIGAGSDKYEEYVYANNTFVKIGDTSIDLSGYAKLEDIPNTSDFVTTSALSTKQDKINDLDTIRNGANKGLTALQSFTETDPTVPQFLKLLTTKNVIRHFEYGVSIRIWDLEDGVYTFGGDNRVYYKGESSTVSSRLQGESILYIGSESINGTLYKKTIGLGLFGMVTSSYVIISAWTSISDGYFEQKSDSYFQAINQRVSTWTQEPNNNRYPSEKLVYDSIITKINEPDTEGVNGQVLSTDGNGGRHWITVSGGSSSTSVEEIYIGTEEPTDDNVKMWIVPTGDADSVLTAAQVEQLIDNKLNDVLNELY